MKKLPKNQRKLMSTCTWCKEHIPDNVEVFGMGAKIRQGTDFRPKEDQFLELSLLDARTVYAFVPKDGTEAKENGHDLMFMTCSEECAEKVSSALKNDIDYIDEVSKM